MNEEAKTTYERHWRLCYPNVEYQPPPSNLFMAFWAVALEKVGVLKPSYPWLEQAAYNEAAQPVQIP